MRLYHKAYQLQVGTPRIPAMASYGNVGQSSPLRIAFDVEKGMTSSPNKGTIKIFNLSAKNRAQFVSGMLANLAVGYGDQMQTLFLGVVARVVSAREGPDIGTILECDDGGPVISQTHLHRSYGPGTLLSTILKDVATTMALVTATNPAGMDAGIALGIPKVSYAKGIAVSGPCSRILDRLCKPAGLEWSIQNNALQILPKKSHTGESAELLSKQTGLLGVPSTEKDKVVFSSLLNPRLTPGRQVLLKSLTVNGLYKIRGGKWMGDTHGPQWQCDIEAVGLHDSTQSLPSSSGFDFEEE